MQPLVKLRRLRQALDAVLQVQKEDAAPATSLQVLWQGIQQVV